MTNITGNIKFINITSTKPHNVKTAVIYVHTNIPKQSLSYDTHLTMQQHLFHINYRSGLQKQDRAM